MIQLKTATILLVIFWTISLSYGQIPPAEPAIEENISAPQLEGPMGPDLISQLFGKDSIVDIVLQNREKYRFQFMLTELAEAKSQVFLGQTHDYSVPNWYFYPASMVKLPIALMSLEKLKATNFSTKATLKFKRDFECGNMQFVDESRQKNLNFETMLRKLIIVSNNRYYNSLYHFVTPEKINEELELHGFDQTNIYKDFTGCEMPLNLKTHGFSLQEKDSTKIYSQESSQLELKEFASHYSYDTTKLLGSKSEYRGKIVDGPFDFNYNLEYSIRDIHKTSMSLFFPQFTSEKDTWNIREEDRQLLLESMKSVPKDLKEKEYYNAKKYPDNLYKYVVHGDDNPVYSSVISYSKMGISYGFVTETAYIIHPETKRQYVLTVSIYVNKNDTVNDGKYEYDELARPFLARFGQLLLEL